MPRKKKDETEAAITLKAVINQLGQGELALLQKEAGDKLRQNKAKETPIVRIGTTWYIYDQYLNKYNVTSPTELKRDYGDSWSWDKPRYLDWKFEPSYLDHQKEIHTPAGVYLNSHSPVNWNIYPGPWTVIDRALTHMFGDKKDFALDWIKVLLTLPKHPLPIFCLVGVHDSGKTWFAKLVQMIISNENSIEIDATDFTEKFNSHWAHRHLLVIDETETDGISGRNTLSAKLKKLTTSDRIVLEKKGKDAFDSNYYGKIIACSNREKSFLKIEKTDTRYFVNKVEPLPDELRIPTFEEDVKKELPCFLNHVLNERPLPPRRSRLYFSFESYRTTALDAVKDNSNSAMVSDIREVLYEWFEEPMELDQITNTWSIIDKELLYDKSMLSQIKCKHWRFSGTEIINLLRKKGLQTPNHQWLKKCMEEELGLKQENKYDKIKGQNKRGWLITEDFIVKLMN